MKKIICGLLAAVLLMGLLAACSGNRQNKPQPNIDDSTNPSDGSFVDNIFDPTNGNAQAQDSTKATEGQNSTTQNQQNPGASQSAQSTKPTEGQQSSGTAESTEPTAKPTRPEEPTATPTQPTEEPTEQPTQPEELTGLAAEYKAYYDMTATQKTQFQNSFDGYDAFFAWYNAAFKAYQDANPPTQIPSDGNITLN